MQQQYRAKLIGSWPGLSSILAQPLRPPVYRRFVIKSVQGFFFELVQLGLSGAAGLDTFAQYFQMQRLNQLPGFFAANQPDKFTGVKKALGTMLKYIVRLTDFD
ncbi:hypothetical protein P2G88_17900 [Aliiglaciecola sp. CAU 1673]|uniref:hypothetical protein n=1 Tax=Aliiglaciecola sp. CAU 1673 TaxID=3032595 RepID=UPI0023DC60F4|nr:hypothetical protein [Aliiglaciecola sp. CAU 1673]MDF2180132.1 hypothetical protein [Aliiglaciecola sp. CAU 1673]